MRHEQRCKGDGVVRDAYEKRHVTKRRVEVEIPDESSLCSGDDEVLLAFLNVAGAEAFREWWSEQGETLMAQWCIANGYVDEVVSGGG